MPGFAFIALVGWLPAVFYLFEKYPVRKAVVFSFVTAWLFLPTASIPLPGFPDWSKMTATVTSVCLCAALKSPGRFFSIQPRWFDLPVVVFCSCPFVASILNGQGAYDGVSAVLEETFKWGLPYLIGRALLADLDGIRQLCVGIAVGGLCYVPFCLFELRMSPILAQKVYGLTGRGAMDFGMRYGGYRPMVFLNFGLELGWWMCCATLASYMLWVSGSLKKVRGYPMKTLTTILAVVTVLCKATGALTQIVIGFVLIRICRKTQTKFLAWALLAIGPIYCVARPFGFMTGDSLVAYSSAAFGEDRAQSLGFRFWQEETLMRSAMQRPIWGWSRNGGFNPPDASGKAAITDGYWIIVFGTMGYVGLVGLNGMLLVPTALFLGRFRAKDWMERDVAPVTTLAVLLPLFMMDNLSNAMLNPIYAIAMGAVAGYVPSARKAAARRASADSGSSSSASSRSVGGFHEIGSERSWQTGDLAFDEAAHRFEADAIAAVNEDRYPEADDCFQRAIRSRQAAAQARQTPERLDLLAQGHVMYARFLTRIDQIEVAIGERERALAAWRLVAEPDRPAETREMEIANLNDLAWLLLASRRPTPTDVDRAVMLAEEAVLANPELASAWNTLGIARYRRRDHHKAIHALGRSVGLSEVGGHGLDYYYLALANHALGYPNPALSWFDRAEAWTGCHPDLAWMVRDARAEARRHLNRDAVPQA